MTPVLYEVSQRAVQVLTTDGRHLSAGRASLFVLEQIDYLPILARLAAHRPLIWLVEAGYHFIATHRPLFARLFVRS